jgi:Big-like domain-containing protein/Calx-beta domain-containing protein
MKKISHALFRQVLIVISAFLSMSRAASAQSIPVDIVTITAPDSTASETGDNAKFEITRTGPTNSLVNVFYRIGGSASNGVDYVSIQSNLIIPAGSRSGSIYIIPKPDTDVEGTETVELTLTPSPLMNPLSPGIDSSYLIGSPSNAVVYIFDSKPSNSPPVVSIVSPANNSSFYAPTNISIFAKAFAPTGSVTGVEFFADAQDLGPGNLLILDPPGVNGVVGPVYYLNWINPAFGNYQLTAVATTDGGKSATSAPVTVNVLPPPPVVKITNPTNGASFVAPTNIPITAEASSSNADIARVQFYADDHFIGADIGVNKPHYTLLWTNPPPGFYSLHAIAFDNFGGKGSSESVAVTISGTNSTPPGLSLVSIYALDPLAVVGTNCLASYSNRPVAIDWSFRPVTNTASFVVRRSGATNNNLDVYYATSGTASNGVDYALLPGVVTIPAGKRTASIVIYPLAEDVPDCPERVILSLQPPATASSYTVGWPGRAAALIVNCSVAPPPTALLCDGAFHISLPSPTNAPYYRIECSSDMIRWVPVCTNVASQLGIQFTDPQSQNFPSLYYRAIPQTNTPMEYP